ncbi:hypothetical protein HYR99_27020 [Candidatus Poribacteria bacterium]|nr:hypothetical protein [Candidatus Poribacteria bacterium]
MPEIAVFPTPFAVWYWGVGILYDVKITHRISRRVGLTYLGFFESL